MLHEALAQSLRLPNFPHHKHLSDDVIGCEKPNIELVVREAMEAQG
jgi:hypothetical protein